jgi:carboxymethylenebutenolidase
MAFRDYLATEIALDHADGLLSRREALQKLGLLGLSAVAASGLLASCAGPSTPSGGTATTAATGAAPTSASAGPAATPTAPPSYDVAAAMARVTTITFGGAAGQMSGAWAPADDPKGVVLVVHENRGLTDHIRAVAGRLAGDGYSALAPDLLSRAGGTGNVPDTSAALGGIATADLVADLKSSLDELDGRAAGKGIGAIGFCVGGGMLWQLLTTAPPALKAAVPFYGPAPENPDYTGLKTAVMGVFAERDQRVNAGRQKLDDALTAAGVTHEMVTVPGVDHAFFNDTGARYNVQAADQIYGQVLAWFGTYLTA